MANSITEFVAEGGELSSSEGLNILFHADDEALKEAAQDSKTAVALMQLREDSVDPYFRKRILDALPQ
jgi:hypothetical protein